MKKCLIRTGCFDLWMHKRPRRCQRNLASVCLRLSLDLSMREEVLEVGGKQRPYMPFSIGTYFLPHGGVRDSFSLSFVIACIMPVALWIEALVFGSFAGSVLPSGSVFFVRGCSSVFHSAWSFLVIWWFWYIERRVDKWLIWSWYESDMCGSSFQLIRAFVIASDMDSG